jgi:hypothetical protein
MKTAHFFLLAAILLVFGTRSGKSVLVNNYVSSTTCSGTIINTIDFSTGVCYPLAISCIGYCDDNCNGEWLTFSACAQCSFSGSFIMTVSGGELFQTDYATSDCSGAGTPGVTTAGGCITNTECGSQDLAVEDTLSFSSTTVTNSGSSSSRSSGSSSSGSSGSSNNNSSSDASTLIVSSALFAVVLLALF